MAKWILALFYVSLGFSFTPRKAGLENVRHQFYSLGYDESVEGSLWTYYKLTPRLINGTVKRGNYFAQDPDVSTGTATRYSYRGTGLDRGHLVPAGDMKYSRLAMVESFFMSNITPQHPSLNRGRWKSLEGKVRNFVRYRGDLHVFTGPVFLKNRRYIPNSHIAIPDGYYKILFYTDGYTREAIAFLMKNERQNGHVLDYYTTVDQIERLTGVDFLHELSDYIEGRVEGHVNLSFWK